MRPAEPLVGPDRTVLVTGASGFLGARVVAALLRRGHRRIRCLVRPSSDRSRLEAVLREDAPRRSAEVIEGNLLSRDDCERAAREAALVYHLAAGTGTRSFADAFLNSVVTTRNLLDALSREKTLERFVNVSSLAVYSNRGKARRGLLDETSPVERFPERRGEAYAWAKAKQDELVLAWARERGLPYVLVRPGVVYGPGRQGIPGRVGVGSFGLFLHLGGSNPLPLTQVDNCAEAVVLAGLTRGVEGETFNIVDGASPSSRAFLRLYKRHVRRFRSLYVPHAASYLLCWLWEAYARWSEGMLPPVFNRRRWWAYWKRTSFSGEKARALLGWEPAIPTAEGLAAYFESPAEGDGA